MQRWLLKFPLLMLLASILFSFGLQGQPLNDNCDGAIPITLGDGTVTDLLTNVDATTDEADGELPGGCFALIDGSPDTYQNTVYYSFVGDGETYTITTSNDCEGIVSPNNDTQLVLFDVCGGTVITCNDDIDGQASEFLSTITVPTTGGTEYILMVDGYDGTVGEFCLDIAFAGPNPECTLDASFFAGIPDEFEPSETPFATGYVDWGGVNPDPATVLIAFAPLNDEGNEPYNVSTSAGETVTSTIPPFALSNLQVNSANLALIALTEDDLANAGETITITMQSANNPGCSTELSFATADFTPDFSAYAPGGNTGGGGSLGLDDGVCDPTSTIENIEDLGASSVCVDGTGVPPIVAPEASLPDIEFVVEANGVIQDINTDGSLEGVALAEGDEVCYTAFAYDLAAINELLNTAAGLCPALDCDELFGLEGINDGIVDIVAGDNPGSTEPGLENLQEALNFASFFGTEIVSVATASQVLNTLNENIGGLLGNICYATSDAVCLFAVPCGPTECEAQASILAPSEDDPCETGFIAAEVVDAAFIPEGYIEIFVLTTGEDLSLLSGGLSPEFSLEEIDFLDEFLSEDGLVTIHSFVVDTLTFPGENEPETGGEVFELLIDGGGEICASLDVAGAAFVLEECGGDTTIVVVDGPFSDGVCEPESTVDPIDAGQANVCSDGSDAPVLSGTASLPDLEFVVEVNGTIESINPTGSLDGITIAEGDEVCYTGFAYDLAAINELLNTAAGLCPALNCDELFGLEGINDGIAEIVAGDNPGSAEPGLENLEEALDFASFFGQAIVSVPTAAAVLDTLNVNIGGLLGNICYATTDASCVNVVNCGGVDCEAQAGTLSPSGDDPCDTGIISAEIVDASVVPEGYIEVFVLTEGPDLEILDIGSVPEFEVESSLSETYTIHTFVLDTLTFPGNTDPQTGGEVFAVTIEGGGDICASLDVPGAVFDLPGCPEALEIEGLDTSISPDETTYTISFEITGGSGDYNVEIDGSGTVTEVGGEVSIEEVDCTETATVIIFDNASGEVQAIEVESPCEPAGVFACEDYPIEIAIDYDCNGETGIYTLTYAFTGGMPEYAAENGSGNPDDFFYTVSGDLSGEFDVTDNNHTLTYTDAAPFSISIVDNFGCVADTSGTPEPCIKTSIQLIEFDGKPIEEGNSITWVTASESYNNNFVLERSYDEVNFIEIAQINGAGNSNVINEYDFLDDKVTELISYYRLIDVEQLGTENISDVITVIREDANPSGFGVIGPIPSKDKIVFAATLNSIKNPHIQITSGIGKLIDGGGRPAIEGMNEIDVSSFPAGLYFLQLMDGDRVIDTVKFIKQ